jgi:leucyl aminopeptidase
VEVSIDTGGAETTPAGLLCIGIFDGDDLPDWLADAPGAGDVRTGAKKLTVLRPATDGAPPRALVVGLGKRGDFDPERARVAASFGVRQAARYEVEAIAWEVPGGAPETACAIAGASVLTAYRFDRLKSKPDPDSERGAGPKALLLHGVEDPDGTATELVAVAVAAAEGANRARDLQNLPANIADPEYLAERARAIAAEHASISVEILDAARITELGMGGLRSVGAGSAKDPLMIVLSYEPPEAPEGSETLAVVGKAVTFDTGGISLKPSASMQDMKMDMSGGAAALEATATIAELGIPLRLLTVVPAVENMPGGNATRPGDVITQLNGRTVEVNNTDAEGRLILADALTWAARNGADRMVDLATLTGAVVVALGSTYAAVAGTDDALADAIVEAGGITGELAWRMPMHPEYLELMKGTVADLSNASPKRKAGSLTAAAFLGEFVEGKPWAHIDIAGTAWDVGRPYVGKGPSGYGVRLLVELARKLAAQSA